MRRLIIMSSIISFALTTSVQSIAQFIDVPMNHWAYSFIGTIEYHGITSGCGNGNYCPAAPVTRAQMAVFLERGIHGSDFSPPAATGNVFLDVAATDFAASFIEQFSADGITSGCGNNNYCPNADVTRAQMAVFLLRAKHGAGYSPPAAVGIFSDVPLSHWAVHWIEQLAAEGITSGCGNGIYCPNAVVTRDQMAVFLVRTFSLEAPPPDVVSIASVTQVGQLTGQLSMNNTDQVNVYGTDLGSMFSHSDGRIYFLFGDTFGPPGVPGSADWRSNTMAYTTDFVASDGITFDGWITDPSGDAKALVEGNHDPNDGSGEVTKIPTAGWSYGGRQFMWYMSVKRWGAAGQWEVKHSEIAYSDDDGVSWNLSGTQWPSNSNFIQVAVTEHGGYLLIWGIPAGRFGGVKLARVPPSDALDDTAYEYYTGAGWSSNEEDGQMIIESPVGELSVLWNPYLKRWIMTYLNEDTASIEIRDAGEPTGPWSQPLQLVSGNDYPALYGAFMHNQYTENNGQTVYFLMSQFGFYNVFLMQVNFE